MRTLLFILLSGLCASAQSMMPPKVTPFKVPAIKVKGNTNNYQPEYTTITLGWTLSKSPNIESQLVYRSPTLKPFAWGMVAVLDDKTISYTVERTNPPMAFFAVQAVNSNGFGSRLPP